MAEVCQYIVLLYVNTVSVCCVQIRQAASGLDLTEEQYVELQSQHWGRFYSICVQYQQVASPNHFVCD